MKNAWNLRGRWLAASFLGWLLLGTAANSWACGADPTVNDLGDTPDANVGNGSCDDGTGKCTLRAALQEANAETVCVPRVITIGVQGNITPATTLPTIAHPQLTIDGPGANLLAVNGGLGRRVFDVDVAGTVTFKDLSIANGFVSGLGFPDGIGGGLRVANASVTLERVSVRENAAHSGGGISVNPGSLTLLNSTVHDNTALIAGGGIYFDAPAGGTLSVTNSTITGNEVGDGGSNGGGGGISIFLYATTTFNLVSSTIAGNTADVRGGGVETWNTTYALGGVLNTIIAGNVASSQVFAPDWSGALVTNGHNLVGNSKGLSFPVPDGTDLVGTEQDPIDPRLGDLAYSNSTTPVLPLLDDSPAINAGTVSGVPATDQRGVSRPQGSGPDIGAYETMVNHVFDDGFEDQ